MSLPYPRSQSTDPWRCSAHHVLSRHGVVQGTVTESTKMPTRGKKRQAGKSTSLTMHLHSPWPRTLCAQKLGHVGFIAHWTSCKISRLEDRTKALQYNSAPSQHWILDPCTKRNFPRAAESVDHVPASTVEVNQLHFVGIVDESRYSKK